MKKHLELIGLVALLLLLVASNSLLAWTAPTQSPPNGNVAAPINTSSVAQSKTGLLGATEILVATGMLVNRATYPNSARLAVSGNVAATAYCDVNGTNCFTPTSVGQSIGNGQTWQNVRASRAVNTTYRNTTGRPIMVSIVAGGNNETIRVSADNTNWVVVGVAGNYYAGNTGFVVPNDHYYRIDGNPYAGVPYWSELR